MKKLKKQGKDKPDITSSAISELIESIKGAKINYEKVCDIED